MAGSSGRGSRGAQGGSRGVLGLPVTREAALCRLCLAVDSPLRVPRRLPTQGEGFACLGSLALGPGAAAKASWQVLKLAQPFGCYGATCVQSVPLTWIDFK